MCAQKNLGELTSIKIIKEPSGVVPDKRMKINLLKYIAAKL